MARGGTGPPPLWALPLSTHPFLCGRLFQVPGPSHQRRDDERLRQRSVMLSARDNALGCLALASTLLVASCCAALSSGEASSRPHVCIVGGGIAGAVTAHYLGNATETDLTLFEAAPRVGGRIASARLAPDLVVEAGASVLAAENVLFARLAAELGLSRKGPSAADAGPMRMGLWDGEAFRYRSTGRRRIDPMRMLWRYGLALLRMRRYVSSLLVNFDRLYTGADKGYEDVEDLLARAPGMFALTQQPFEETAGASFGAAALVDELVSAVSGRWR